MARVRNKPNRSGKYQGNYLDDTGKRRLFVGTGRKAETVKMAQRLEDDPRPIRLGYRPVPKSAEEQRHQPLAEATACNSNNLMIQRMQSPMDLTTGD